MTLLLFNMADRSCRGRQAALADTAAMFDMFNMAVKADMLNMAALFNMADIVPWRTRQTWNHSGEGSRPRAPGYLTTMIGRGLKAALQ